MSMDNKLGGKPPVKKIITPKLSVPVELTPEERAEVEASAKAQIAQEMKRKLKAQYLEELLKQHKLDTDPDSNTFQRIVIDVAGHSDRIIIDGKHYFHGVSYEFDTHQARTIKDIMARTWDHENEIGGSNRHIYRKPANLVLSPNNPQGLAGF